MVDPPATSSRMPQTAIASIALRPIDRGVESARASATFQNDYRTTFMARLMKARIPRAIGKEGQIMHNHSKESQRFFRSDVERMVPLEAQSYIDYSNDDIPNELSKPC